MGQQDLKGAEYQADMFAGLVLVPESALPAVTREVFADLARQTEGAEIDLMGDAFWNYIARDVGARFRVALPTARIRLTNDGLWRKPLQ